MDKMFDSLRPLLDQAIASRRTSSRAGREEAFRLFNGFYEGCPDLTLDVFGRTLVVHDHSEQPDDNFIFEVSDYVKIILSWLRAVVIRTQSEKRGRLLIGEVSDRKINEHGVWYALDLTMTSDTGFYLDTRNLRKWLLENARGKTVLNTFAYTGSLGVAAIAGGAAQVTQTDRNRQFLNLAKDSYSINGFPIQKQNFIAQDFFPAVAHFKAQKQTFDCVILDPPFFSVTPRGKVDLQHESGRLINKVRPLVNDGGVIIAVNNAVFLSGTDYMRTLETLCQDGYLSIRELIPVPEDFIGLQRISKPITDPAPFNHSTKIAVLDVRRK
jgi:23S rRNA (cytosine1962-C5)-methyltransferase